MNKQNILAAIKSEKPYLQENFGVEEIALFGSYARGDEKADSDVDILGECFNSNPLTKNKNLVLK